MQHRFGTTARGGGSSSATCRGARGISRAARAGRRHGVGPSRSGGRRPRRPRRRSLGRRDRRDRRSRTSRGRSRGSLGAALAAADRER